MSIIAHMFGAILLVNSVPHFVQGVSGNEFHSPFADPPFVGRSSAVTNVLWGGANFTAGCALLFGVGSFDFGPNLDALLVFAAGLLAAVGIARSLERVRRREDLGVADEAAE